MSRHLGWILLLAAACSAPPQPNVVLVTLDTTRSDHLSAYGYDRPTSPNLEKLAADGARFDAAYATSATTAPTHASIFTGLHPPVHGVVRNGVPLSEATETLAERFAAEGYQTAAFVSSFVLQSRFGLDRGFEIYDDDFEKRESSGGGDSFEWEGRRVYEVFDRRADHTTRRAVRWLKEERDPNRPFLLFVHYFDPHDPYRPPRAFSERFASDHQGELERLIALYDAEIAFTDLQLGVLLRALDDADLRDETLVVVTADHGEGLLDHGHMAHGAQLYEEATRVPLLARWPGRIPPGRVVDAHVSLVDLAPSLMDLAGVRGPELGRSFAAAFSEVGEPVTPRPVFLFRRPYPLEPVGEAESRGSQFGVRSGRWKYLEAPEEETQELYDLVDDPAERRDLWAEQPGVARDLQQLLAEWRQSHPQGTPAPSVNPRDRERLRALGYGD
ncbi:sulfatase-like hydrolase/transferase [Myxococcota bacterium]|nr:sulfatase-like hydrolase/transferase [Myxococcota bacterium]